MASRYKPKFKREAEGVKKRCEFSEREEEEKKLLRIKQLITQSSKSEIPFEENVVAEVDKLCRLWQKGFTYGSYTARIQMKLMQFFESILENSTPSLKQFAEEAIIILKE